MHEFEGNICTFFPSFDNIADFAPLIFFAIRKVVGDLLFSELYETRATHVTRKFYLAILPQLSRKNRTLVAFEPWGGRP
jgi:hypothetical protein